MYLIEYLAFLLVFFSGFERFFRVVCETENRLLLYVLFEHITVVYNLRIIEK